MTRPETHQNLIHTVKEHNAQAQSPDAKGRIPSAPPQGVRQRRSANLDLLCDEKLDVAQTSGRRHPAPHTPELPWKQTAGRRALPPKRGAFWWKHQSTCFGGGERVRTDDPLLAKQVLSQLSYTPTQAGTAKPPTPGPPLTRAHPQSRPSGAPPCLVGQGGFEPPTPRLSSVCSNQLSY